MYYSDYSDFHISKHKPINGSVYYTLTKKVKFLGITIRQKRFYNENGNEITFDSKSQVKEFLATIMT